MLFTSLALQACYSCFTAMCFVAETWQIERDLSKFSCPNFPLKILVTMRRANGMKAGS